MKIPAFILAGIVTGLLLGGAGAHAQQAEQPRTVGVSGQGEVRAEPDRATVTLGVESRKPKLDDARAEVAKTVDAVLKLTRDLKVDQKLVRATRVNVQPEYNWSQQANERNLIGYYVSRQVEVELHDLEKLGQLLERATDLGVNQMGDPRLDSSKRSDLVREALAKAVADARQNAEVIAKAAGARLGAARTINANTEFTPPPMPMVRAMAMEAKAAPAAPYQSGEMTFNATVNVQYDLIPQ
ncbi:MAG TPA: SIMPL domain-containing protein [Steroidobacteraceae bacterium]|nr:SIMPL domain-containing protein [Steroidobacteraceae bacterium]